MMWHFAHLLSVCTVIVSRNDGELCAFSCICIVCTVSAHALGGTVDGQGRDNGWTMWRHNGGIMVEQWWDNDVHFRAIV